MFKIIDRYLTASFLLPLSYCLTAFFVLFVAYDMADQLRDFLDKQIPPYKIATYYVYYIPIIFQLTAPFATLLAMLYCLGNMSRTNEIIAMRASGIALFRIIRPYLLMGVVLYGVTLVVSDVFVPQARRLAAEIMPKPTTVHSVLTAPLALTSLDYVNAQHDRQWKITTIQTESNVFRNVTVIQYTHGRERRPNYKLEAARAEYISGYGWWFFDVRRISYFLDGSFSPVRRLSKYHVPETRWNEQPQDLLSARQSEPELMTFQDLLRQMRNADRGSDNYRKLRMEMHNRLAQPAACLVFVLLAAPFGIFHTRAGMVKGVITSIMLCLVYYLVLALFVNLGTNGYLPQLLAAWLPSIVFAWVGAILLYRMR
jgi:lipopolysaccharide export system permease protein